MVIAPVLSAFDPAGGQPHVWLSAMTGIPGRRQCCLACFQSGAASR